MRTHVLIVWKGTSSAAVPHSISYLPGYRLQRDHRNKFSFELNGSTYVEMSVIPLPMSTLRKLIGLRPAAVATRFWSYM